MRSIDEIMNIVDGNSPFRINYLLAGGLGYKPYLPISGGNISDDDEYFNSDEFHEELQYFEDNINELDEDELNTYLMYLAILHRISGDENINEATELDNKIENVVDLLNEKFGEDKYKMYKYEYNPNNKNHDDYDDENEDDEEEDKEQDYFNKIVEKIKELEKKHNKTKKDKELLSQLFKIKYGILKRNIHIKGGTIGSVSTGYRQYTDKELENMSFDELENIYFEDQDFLDGYDELSPIEKDLNRDNLKVHDLERLKVLKLLKDNYPEKWDNEKIEEKENMKDKEDKAKEHYEKKLKDKGFNEIKKIYEDMKDKENKAKEHYEKKLKEKSTEGWRILNLDLKDDNGYSYFLDNKKKNKIDKPNGLAFEELMTIEPQIYEPIQQYTNDFSAFNNLGDELMEKKFVPNEKIYELWKKEKMNYGNNYLYPWNTLPFDLFNNNNFIENKNYIHIGSKDTGWKGETINNDEYIKIQRMKDKGKTNEEIENEIKNIQTIPITKNKLTTLNKFGKKNDWFFDFERDGNNIYATKLYYTGKYPSSDGTKLINVDKKVLWQGKKNVLYDILTNNARVIYEPLKDKNLKLNNGSINTSFYKNTSNNRGEQFFNVPLTQLKIKKNIKNKY